MISVPKTMANASFDVSPASSTQAPDKPVAGTSTRAKHTMLELPSRVGHSGGEERPRSSSSSSSKLRLSSNLNRGGGTSAHRQPNGAPYDLIRYRDPGTGQSAEVAGVKTAAGGFDIKNTETGETIGRLAIVDSRQPDGTPGERVGVDPDHAKLPGGMQSWRGGHYGHPIPAASAGSSTGPGTAAFHAQQGATAMQPWYAGNQQIAAHVPPLTTQNLTPLDQNQLGLALNPGNRPVRNYRATSDANGITTHRFQVQMGPQLQPLGVTAIVRNGVLVEIRLSPSNKRFHFAAQAPTYPAPPPPAYGNQLMPAGGHGAAPMAAPPFRSRRRQMPLEAQHRELTSNDTRPYRQLESQYAQLFRSGAIERAPETQSYLFHDVLDVGMDDPRVIRQSQGAFIATDGLGPCIAICARGVDSAGQSVLGMYHYSGAIETPLEAMEQMNGMMAQHGAVNVSYSLIGGMITPQEQDSGSLDNERGFLSLSDRFPIEGVRLHVSEGEHDAMGFENSVGVVLSDRGAVYRSEALYPYAS
ncbi:XopAK family type III secretion system effector [Paraburkholderia bannensis]|uniref:XopAK family type III secretion system effector n=1 Tax=Paraburkholderia bannensis TaxID=765414 RepID=UPI002AB6C32F|nr:XopAK family type III secretion system effector [Paraburkholderia bannensis]